MQFMPYTQRKCGVGSLGQVVFYWTLVARHICRVFDLKPQLRPPISQQMAGRRDHQITLSKMQIAQIEEIFNLFDTDGGGTIDRSELELALVALGFQRKISAHKRLYKRKSATAEFVNSIASDGTVTLEEFTSLMMGEIKGSDPMDNVEAVFAILSQDDEHRESNGYITVAKLSAMCKAYEVSGCNISLLAIFTGHYRRRKGIELFFLVEIKSPKMPCTKSFIQHKHCFMLIAAL
jgi:Ca2+-binding EF-hand superfamily protein